MYGLLLYSRKPTTFSPCFTVLWNFHQFYEYIFLIHQGESETSSLPTIHMFHLLYNYYKQYYAILHSIIKNSLNKKLHWIRLFVIIMCTSFLMKKAYIGTAYCLILYFTLKKKYMLKSNLKSKLFVFRGMKTMIILWKHVVVNRCMPA